MAARPCKTTFIGNPSVNHQSMDWFKGKITGKHGFYHQLWSWLVVWNMIFFFQCIGNIHPNLRTHNFQWGTVASTTNQLGFCTGISSPAPPRKWGLSGPQCASEIWKSASEMEQKSRRHNKHRVQNNPTKIDM